MSDSTEPKELVEKYMEQMMRLAAEAGQMLDRTVDLMEKSSKEFIGAVSKEAKGNSHEIKRMATEVMGEVKHDIPRVRAELREMEARARERLRKYQHR